MNYPIIPEPFNLYSAMFDFRRWINTNIKEKGALVSTRISSAAEHPPGKWEVPGWIARSGRDFSFYDFYIRELRTKYINYLHKY